MFVQKEIYMFLLYRTSLKLARSIAMAKTTSQSGNEHQMLEQELFNNYCEK